MLLPHCPIGHGLLTEFFHWLTPIVGWVPGRERREGKGRDMDWYKERRVRSYSLHVKETKQMFLVGQNNTMTPYRLSHVWMQEISSGRLLRPEILGHSEVFELSWEFTDNYLRGRSSCFHPALLLQCLLQHTSPVWRVAGAERFGSGWDKKGLKSCVTTLLCLISDS